MTLPGGSDMARPTETDALGERRVGRRAEQKRRWDAENRRGTCEVCGAPTWKRAPRCGEHKRTGRHDERRDEIVRLWNQGVGMRQIEAAVGLSKGQLNGWMARMRRQGYDLPHRYQVRDRSVA